ncbi:MAG: TonB-dependent receptor [Bacteroidota bacterium]
MRYICSFLMAFITLNAKAQTGNIKGKIHTTDGKPAADVSVIIKEADRAVITGPDGSFVVRNLKAGNYSLYTSCTGLASLTRNISIATDQTTELILSLQETARQLDEVIVQSRRTANDKAVTIGKAPINAMDLPQAVTVINQAVLDNQQVQRLSDVMRNVNGIYLSSTRGSTQENFSARGYSLSANNLFKDGVRINSGTMPETSSLERVEILKGSAAVLFGNVAPGGIVNMVTKQPKFQSGGEIALRAGSFGLFKPMFDVYGPLSKNIAFRMNGNYETANSYRDVVHSKRYYANPSLLFKLGKKTELLVQGDYLYHEFTPDFGIGSINNTSIPNVPRSAFFGTPWQYAKTNQSSATATLKHTLTNSWQLNASVSYQYYNRDYYATERIQALANGDWYRPLNRAKNIENYYTAQANLSGKFKLGSTEHTLLAGLDADQYDAKAYSYNQPTVYDTINILNPQKYTARTDIPAVKEIKLVTTPTLRMGAYVQDLISVSAHLKILAGIRWSIQEAKAASTSDLLTGITSMGTIKTDKAFSPRAGIVYQPTKNTSLFASYANSFSVNGGTDVYGNALAPSIIDQYEAGVKNNLFSGMLMANLTVYKIINNNLAQTALFAADGVTPNNNTALKALTGQTTSDGLEIDLISHPAKGLDINLGYSYNYIRYTKTPDAKGNFVEGERLQNSVGSTANTSIFYSYNGWKFGTTVFYTGPRTAGFNNTKGQTQNYNRLFAVNDFTTIDLSAGYSWRKLGLLAKISNLTNTLNYYTHENYSINPIPPTQLIATVTYRFN